MSDTISAMFTAAGYSGASLLILGPKSGKTNLMEPTPNEVSGIGTEPPIIDPVSVDPVDQSALAILDAPKSQTLNVKPG